MRLRGKRFGGGGVVASVVIKMCVVGKEGCDSAGVYVKGDVVGNLLERLETQCYAS